MTRDDPLEVIATRERLVWVSAIVLYGVGDTVTTFWGLSIGGVAEAGPIAGPAVEAYGRGALLGIKVVTFALFSLAWRMLWTPGRVAVPLALAVVGGVVTVWNLLVVASALW